MDVSQAGQGGVEKITGPCPLESASPGKLRSQTKETHSTDVAEVLTWVVRCPWPPSEGRLVPELSKERGWKAAVGEG